MYQIVKKSATEIALVSGEQLAKKGASINVMSPLDVPENAVSLCNIRGWYVYESTNEKSYSLMCMPTDEDVIDAMTDDRINSDLRAKNVEEAREWAREKLCGGGDVVFDVQLIRILRQLAEHLELEIAQNV